MRGEKNKNPPRTQTSQMFFVYKFFSPFFRGEGDISIGTVLVLRFMKFFGSIFWGFFSPPNDYFFIVVVKMSVAFQVSVSLAMK